MPNHTWIPIHREAAHRLLTYKDRQDELLALLTQMHNQGLTVIGLNDQNPKGAIIPLSVIDPFTFLASFNRGTTEEKRRANWEFLKNAWNLEAPVPEDFLGIPIANNQKSWWFPNAFQRDPEHVPALWSLVEQAIDKTPEEIDPDLFNRCIGFNGTAIKNLTMGLFWINPEQWLAVDSFNQTYLKHLGIDAKVTEFSLYLALLNVYRNRVNQSFAEFSYQAWKWNPTEMDPLSISTNVKCWVISPGEQARLWIESQEIGIISLGWDELGDLTEYASRDEIREALVTHYGGDSSYKNNSLALWDFVHSVNQGDIIYAKQGTERVLGWGTVSSDYLFDSSRKEHKHVRKVEWKNTTEVTLPESCRIPLKTLTNVDGHPKFLEFVKSFYEEDEIGVVEIDPALRQYWWLNASPKVWDFKDLPIGDVQIYTARNDKGNKRQKFKYFEQVRPGDVVIGYLTTPVKQIVSICEITKGMKETKGEGFEFRKIEDLAKPISWEELQAMPQIKDCEPILNNQGSLFKITNEEYDYLRSLFDERQEVSPVPAYSREQALEDLFMSEKEFDQILTLLKRKKNIVLQGPPGVGKTFVARRLAYASMKQKDQYRAPMVQFHQSYAYEDFIQGYRPDGKGGFFLKNGTFHTLCRQAQRDNDRDYFLVIDEINRGNLSKIFGELMMLMETDKRGPQHALQLAYAESIDDIFYIPTNLHIIGTMNTADRSLAMVDYALRRRFAFITLKPEFSNGRFHQHMLNRGANATLIDAIITRVEALNQLIRDDSHNLGWGYTIGHSFFCPSMDTVPDVDWLRQVIEFEVAPLLREYWVDDEGKAEAELEKLRF